MTSITSSVFGSGYIGSSRNFSAIKANAFDPDRDLVNSSSYDKPRHQKDETGAPESPHDHNSVYNQPYRSSSSANLVNHSLNGRSVKYDDDQQIRTRSCDHEERSSIKLPLEQSEGVSGVDNLDVDGSYCSTSSTESDGFDRYEFRQGTRNNPLTFVGVWVDNDETGNYDPTTKGRPNEACSKRKGATREPGNGIIQADETCPRKKARRSLLSARQHGDRFMITFKFHTNAAKSGLQRYVEHNYQGHPSGSNEASAEEVNFATNKHPTSALQGANRLRRRQEPNNTQTKEEFNREGHPAARGCKACQLCGQYCSLLDPERIYPCASCAEDKIDCELLLQPKKKRACERCKSRKHTCSYTYSDDHALPCHACSQHGFRCFAGPYLDPTCTRLTIDGKPGTVHEPPPRPKRTKRKDRQGIEQNLSQNHVVSNQKDTTSIGRPESIEQVDETVQEQNAHGTSLIQRSEPEVAIDPPPSTRKVNGPMIEIINTKLIHPLTFNYSGSKSCHWCEDPIYGIMGVGTERRVRVKQWPNGCGCEELPWASLGPEAEPSRCCAKCTFKRILVVTCGRHRLQPIIRQSSEQPDWESTFVRLMSCPPGTEREEMTDKFCYICPALAVFECCTKPETNGAGPDTQTTSSNSKSGCGLRLCKTCSMVLNGMFGGDLQKMVARTNTTDDRWPLGLRADYDFFRADGYMVKQVLSE